MNAKTLGWIAAILVIGLVAWRFMRAPGSSRTSPRDRGSAQSQTADLPRRPAPRMSSQAPVPEEVTENLQPTSILERPVPTLSLAQVEGYLHDNKRNAASLIGAFQLTHDQSLLAEAKEKFPKDPQVAFVAATQISDPPEERRKWLDTLKQLAPQNAMADYLSAADHFQQGQTDQALQEVQAAANKSLQNYQLNFLQNAQEGYRAAGNSEAEARAFASMSLPVPELSRYKAVGIGLVDLAKAYQQAGDMASAQAALQMVVDLGQRLNEPGSLTYIQQLVAVSIQRNALKQMDPNSVLAGGNQTVQSQLDAIERQRAESKSLVQQWNAVMPGMSEQDVISFIDRHWHFGEIEAFRWAVTKYGAPPSAGQP